MARLTAVYRSFWTPPDLGRNTTLCDWLLGFGCLFFGMAIFTLPDTDVSVALFKFAGWFVTCGSLVQRFQTRLWPFDSTLTIVMKRLAKDLHRMAVTIYEAEMQAEHFTRVLGMISLATFGIILLVILVFAR